MPHHKSCKKRLKTSAKARVRNNALKTVIRRTLRDARSKAEEGEQLDLNKLYETIDQSWSKGLIHRNKASRLKARMAKMAARVTAE